MAFDGYVISNLVYDCNKNLVGGRINKIYQPESDELILAIKNEKTMYRLYLCASATLPLMYFTENQKENPMVAPNFCMLLRKHIGSGRIVSVTQPHFERIVDFEIEHRNELGDLCRKHLIIELMGKHSNIIFCDETYLIIDSIKHVNAMMSSIREVLPGKQYEIAPTQNKWNPANITKEEFVTVLNKTPHTLQKAIYQSLTGISPLLANELCFRAGLDGDSPVAAYSKDNLEKVYDALCAILNNQNTGDFEPCIVYEKEKPVAFSSIPLTLYSNATCKMIPSISQVLETFYAAKSAYSRMHQKSTDLRKIISIALERTSKKYDLQCKQLEDTKKREKYKVYGELLNTYGYEVKPGDTSLTALNYYTNETIAIPLDSTLSPKENAIKYFNKYNKLKRTNEALTTLTKETHQDLIHLRSVQISLNMAMTEADLNDIKEELTQCGYIKKHVQGKKKQAKSKPLHFVSSDGIHMYVGKNNFQNDELTFKFANAGDWWFHANDLPGSHVIVKKEQRTEIPDATFEEAARLAAYYSESRNAKKVEIDYTLRGNLKKPTGAKPGYVIYHTNYSIIAEPNIDNITQIN